MNSIFSISYNQIKMLLNTNISKKKYLIININKTHYWGDVSLIECFLIILI